MIQNNQPPDVLNLNSFSGYAKDGLLYSADEVLSPNTKADFLDAFARGGEYQGKLYGFPILASARAFFYNKDLLAKAGVAAPLKTCLGPNQDNATSLPRLDRERFRRRRSVEQDRWAGCSGRAQSIPMRGFVRPDDHQEGAKRTTKTKLRRDARG